MASHVSSCLHVYIHLHSFSVTDRNLKKRAVRALVMPRPSRPSLQLWKLSPFKRQRCDIKFNARTKKPLNAMNAMNAMELLKLRK